LYRSALVGLFAYSEDMMTKEIELTQGKVALVDDEDYEMLMEYKWYARIAAHTYYAATKIPFANIHSRRNMRMHRLIMDATNGTDVDHINHDGIDNRKANLRICTRSQNQSNRRKRAGCSSQYKGVSWYARGQVWQVHIKVNYQNIYLGRFANELDAADAYDEAARKHFGEFALTNDEMDTLDHTTGQPGPFAWRGQGQHRKRNGCSSKYKGVSWEKRAQKWKAQFATAPRHLGYFDSEADAARAYNDAATEHFGEFALLNEIEEA